MTKIENEIRLLKIYSGLLTLVCVGLAAAIVILVSNKKFDEIDVERINVLEKDGTLRLVISNKERQHPGLMDGITYEERRGKRPPGLMFFNEKGDELGGLVFDGNSDKGQGGSLTFDKFRGDQTIQFIHEEGKDETYFAGLKMSDQNMPLNDLIKKQKEISELPTKEAQDSAYQSLRDQGLLMTERLRLGKERDKSSIIKLKDAKGRVRLELKVEAAGAASISFLDESGKVVQRLPENSKVKSN